MRSIYRTRVAGLCFSALMVAGLGTPSSASTSGRMPRKANDQRVVLRGTNVIEGSKSASVPVRLTSAATIRNPEFAGGKDLKVSGRGRFVGFALFRQGSESEPFGLLGGRLPGKSPFRPVVYGYGFPPEGQDRFVLPAGDYRLYLLADGHDVRVTIDMHGLRGVQRLEPSTSADYNLSVPEPDYDSSQIAPGAPKNLYSGGDHHKLSSDGIIFQASWVTWDANISTQLGDCLYYGRPSGPAPYAPYCPDPTTSRSVSNAYDHSPGVEANGRAMWGGGAIPSGVYGLGFSVTSSGRVTDLGSASVWLGLGDKSNT